MTYTYKPSGVCSRLYEIELSHDGVIDDIIITGGCDGNLKGLTKLLKGRKAEDVIELLEGTVCGTRATSCPDQIAQALKEALSYEDIPQPDDFIAQ